MRFRQDVGGRKVDENSSEERQIDSDVIIIERDGRADRSSTDTSDGIYSEKEYRSLGPIPALDQKGDGVETITEGMDKNRNEDSDTELIRHLEGDTNGDAIDQHMSRHCNRTERSCDVPSMTMLAAVLGLCWLMTAGELLEEVKRHEAADQRDSSDRDVEKLACIVGEGLGK